MGRYFSGIFLMYGHKVWVLPNYRDL